MCRFEVRKCSNCGREFDFDKWYGGKVGKFCSRECLNESRKGKPAPCSFKGRTHSNESKEKMSKVQRELGKTKNKKEVARRNGLANKGKRRTDEFRRQLSEMCKNLGCGKRLPHRSGKKHWNWKGGITPKKVALRKSTRYKKWRTGVFERDGFTCQLCGISAVYLEADHFPVGFATLLAKQDYDKLWDTNNGRTLCKTCHKLVTFGKENKK
jgi:5-methylcytosine-specific restriction endonuclease McrA